MKDSVRCTRGVLGSQRNGIPAPSEIRNALFRSYHDPDVQGDAEGEVHSCQDDGPFELMEQEVDQASLEDEGVEEHEENDDDVEEDRNILDAADT